MMQSLISTQDKRDYIQWFLDTHQLKNHESEWILKYLCKDEELLSLVHFVREDIEDYSRGMIISSEETDNKAFVFFKYHIYTSSTDKAFHDIRMQKQLPLFIQFHYPNAMSCPYYAGVLTENPNVKYYQQDTQQVDALLKYMKYEQQIKNLEVEIDQALDELDKSKFNYLTAKLQQLKEQMNH
ncbi:YpiB family protein [Ornithinibacillus sp. 4-3]|uniref:YpiB family protein n=1 Tax=Ornithinibacillus sp. 4-3 TaxID=3231488 RepID=A0AB39HLD8_9BACI